MITETEYKEACINRDLCQEIINRYHNERAERFKEKMLTNPVFTDEELHYSAYSLCPCGHGLAYPEGCGGFHYWDCSAILKGIADKNVTHTSPLPFSMYDVKGESEHRGTTRGVFKPKVEFEVKCDESNNHENKTN